MQLKIGLLFIGILTCSCMHEVTSSAIYQNCFDGLSNHGKTSDKIYVTAGRKAQIVGIQNATFPDLGTHVEGEMGGIWTGSFKVADGYSVTLHDVMSGQDTLLLADTMVVYPHLNQFDFGHVLNGLKVTSAQFASDKEPGVAIAYTIENRIGQERAINIDFLLNIDISPVWYSKENGIYNTVDIVDWDSRQHLFSAKDSLNNWYMVWGCSHGNSTGKVHHIPSKNKGLVTPASICTDVLLKPGQSETIYYFVASSTESSRKATEYYSALSQNLYQRIIEKKEEIESLLACSQIEIPDKAIEQAYYWTKINNRWLETEVDTIGLFLSAGAVEYPWLFGCDNSYALQGALRTGNFEIAKSTMRLLNKVSERVNGNGRIIHEMSNNGFVGNKGNTQETAHFIMALWDVFLWTGDRELLEEIYPNVKKGIAWLTETMDTNCNLFPEGYGIMEVKGLNAELIDVAVYTQQALEAAACMAVIMHEDDRAAIYKEQADKLRLKINKDFWNEEAQSFCDFYATAADAVKVAEGAIEQLQQNDTGVTCDTLITFYRSILRKAKAMALDAEMGWFTNKNWVINTPMECGIAPNEQGLAALEQIGTHHCGPYGPYLSAVERKRMMTISTGVQAMAEAQYGRIDEAVHYLYLIASTLGRNMPGAINEMMPDYGCPYQAWTIYGMGKVLISGCFGVWPDAYRKTIRLAPQLPEKWNKISLKKLRVGDNFINLEVERKGEAIMIEYASAQPDWTVNLDLSRMIGKEVWVNGKKQDTPLAQIAAEVR